MGKGGLRPRIKLSCYVIRGGDTLGGGFPALRSSSPEFTEGDHGEAAKAERHHQSTKGTINVRGISTHIGNK